MATNRAIIHRLLINYIATFKIYRVNSWSSVYPHGIIIFSWGYFSFSRISSALIPPANSFLTTLSASAFFASSAALASAFVFFAQRAATSGMHRLWWYWFWAGFAAFRSEYSLIPNGLIQLLS